MTLAEPSSFFLPNDPALERTAAPYRSRWDPSELVPIHDAVKPFQSATIAHSQSELTVTQGVGLLSPATLQVRLVMEATMINALPWQVVQEFRTLIATVEELLDRVIAPVLARLEAS